MLRVDRAAVVALPPVAPTGGWRLSIPLHVTVQIVKRTVLGDALLVVGVQRSARDRDVPFGGHGDREVARVEVAGGLGQVLGRDHPAAPRRGVGRVHAVVHPGATSRATSSTTA
jgi:hypothetical protein